MGFSSMALGGRPLAHIDWEKVNHLLKCGCSGRQIAGNLGFQPNTIYDRCVTDHGITFTEYSQQFYAKGESLLLEKQFDKAINNGDNMMLIWLGKNILKQSDSPTQDAIQQQHVEKFDKIMGQLDQLANQKNSEP